MCSCTGIHLQSWSQLAASSPTNLRRWLHTFAIAIYQYPCVAVFLSTYSRLHFECHSNSISSLNFFFCFLFWIFPKHFFSNFTPFFFSKYYYWGVFRVRSRVQTRAKHSENTPRGPRTADRQCNDPPMFEKSMFFRGFVAFCVLSKPLGTHLRFWASQSLRPKKRWNVASGGRNSDQLTSGWNSELRVVRGGSGAKAPPLAVHPLVYFQRIVAKET